MFTLKSRLKRNKRYALLEVKTDIHFIENFRQEALKRDETALRSKLGAQRRKPEDEQNAGEIKSYEYKKSQRSRSFGINFTSVVSDFLPKNWRLEE